MAGSVAAAAKAKLVGTSNVLTSALSSLTGEDAVKVFYNDTRNVLRRVVFGGQVAGTASVSAMKGGTAGRVRREENLSLRLYIRVFEPGHDTTEVTDADAMAIAALIEDYIAANPDLGGGVTGLLMASVEGVELDGFLTDDGSATSILALTVGLKSYLT